MTALTRADLRDAVHREIGLPLREAGEIVDAVIEAVAERLVAGEPVKLSGFGTFSVRAKGARVGRNPRTREAVPIPPRRHQTPCNRRGSGIAGVEDRGFAVSPFIDGGKYR